MVNLFDYFFYKFFYFINIFFYLISSLFSFVYLFVLYFIFFNHWDLLSEKYNFFKRKWLLS